ncbi:c-type cytochrome [Caldimonas tepidiphila]|uniref:c-type cytochrome n=1 Tax=Caldimonas tepidiphila TaxID=2315841 RepID=UPI001F0C0878|nr:c-type cytochrome [Caldimonas tepidiphila]
MKRATRGAWPGGRRLPLRLGAALLAAALVAGCGKPPIDDPRAGQGDPERGMLVMHQHACNACHVIPGVTGPDIHVGPPLEGMARRQNIAGAIPNTIENMVRWLRDPQAIDPKTAMPDMGLTENDALDAAAYLATLH